MSNHRTTRHTPAIERYSVVIHYDRHSYTITFCAWLCLALLQLRPPLPPLSSIHPTPTHPRSRIASPTDEVPLFIHVNSIQF
jgi:hypothetical protein